jgi:threonine synthase
MTTVTDDNVHCVAVLGGGSDELDVPLKRCLTDPDLVQRYGLCSINSINWARILVQVAHYFYIYFRSCDKLGTPLHVVVPTGAGGNVTAGCIANMMGLPIRLVIAQNVNNVLARFVLEGEVTIGVSAKTIAPAMDIQDPYNIERLFYLFSDRNTSVVQQLMKDLQVNRSIQVPANIMEKVRKVIVDSCFTDDAGIEATIRRCWDESSYGLCPHTATAVNYHYRSADRGDKTKHVCVATASLAKFPEVAAQVNVPKIPHPRIDNLTKLPTRYVEIPSTADWYEFILNIIKQIDSKLKNR